MVKRILQLLAPTLAWAKNYRRAFWRHDFIAGVVSALIMIPQAAALASLAGLPPEFGVYTSIIPVIIAALWGSSYHALSGPNTAVALMVSATLFPLANIGTDLYIQLALSLALMVGLIQVAMAVGKFGSLLRFVSPSAITGITNAVGVLIIVSSAWGLLGVHNMIEWHLLTRLNQFVDDIPRANPYALGVGAVTLFVGFLLRKTARRFRLVIAMAIGILLALLLNVLLGEENVGMERLGHLTFSQFAFAVPTLRFDSTYLMQHLLTGALAIALVGAIQAVVIARGIADRSGQHIDKNKEILGQGMANAIGSVCNAFAGSSSFNRSAAHVQSGAKTPLAAVLSALFLSLFILAGANFFSYMPISVMSAVLIMVGWGIIDTGEFVRVFQLRMEALIFYGTFLTALMFGLTEAVLFGMLSSLFAYLRGVSAPKLVVESDIEGVTRPPTLRVRGHLFFGALNDLSSHLQHLRDSDGGKGTIIIDLRDLSYIDWAAVRMLRREAQARAAAGGRLILRLHTNQYDLTLGVVDHLANIGGELQWV